MNSRPNFRRCIRHLPLHETPNLGVHETGSRPVCFDGFGTLVEITDKRGPFRALLKDGEQRSALTREVLTQPLSLRMVARRVTAEVDEGNLQRLEADLIAECGSIRLREGIATMWSELRAGGLKIAVCSNLALPYGPPFLNALPGSPDATVLSYEVGGMKPEPEIYALVCDRLGSSPEHVLFVGDTSAADIDGPRKFGMPAMLISDFLIAYRLLPSLDASRYGHRDSSRAPP